VVKKILGGLFIIFGAGAFVGAGRQQPDYVTGLIAIGVGAYLIYRSKKKVETVKDNRKDIPQQTEKPEKTFSFQAAGFRFKCRFPNTRFDERQFILVRSHVGDSVSLRQYEWEGKPAIALISDKYGADLGVVPATHVNKILKLAEQYTVSGKIISLERIEYRGDFYTKCDIELSCYPKNDVIDAN
jgi:hypothetical protein